MPAPNQFAIQIRLEGANQVVTAVQQVQNQFNSFQQTLQAGFSLNLGAKLADTVLQSIGAFRQAIGEGLRYAAGLKDMSIQSGLTIEAVQVLGQSAAQSGAGIENVRTALTNLRQAATAAQQGNDDLSAAFAQLGLDAAKIANLSLEGQLEAVARGFAATGQDGRSFSALVRLLGERDAPRLQGMLQELARNGLAGMADALRENGALLDAELIEKADTIDDRWGALGTKFKATFARLGILLEPFIRAMQWLVGEALDGLILMVQAFREIATAMGAIGAVLAGADMQTARDEFLKIANGTGQSGRPTLPDKATPGPVAKPTGPTLAEMAAEQQRLLAEQQRLLAEQQRLLAAQQPLWQQRESATAAVARAEQALQRVMAEGNANQQVDVYALATASLAVTKAKAAQAEIAAKIAADLGRQLEQIEQIAKLEASFGPIDQQRAVAQTTLAAAEAEVARLNAAAVVDANALLAAELKRLAAKRELADLDANLASDRANQGNQTALDTADATTRRLAAERAAIDSDFSRTAQEKWVERKRILDEEIANQQALLALLTAKRDTAAASGDPTGAAVYDQSARQVGGGLDTLKQQQGGLGPDPSSIGQQLTAALTAAQTSVGSFAQQIGQAFSSVGESIRTNLGGAFSDMILQGASLKDAALGFSQAIATSFINTGAQMVADWIYSHVIMDGVRSAFHALGITKTAAAEAAKTGIQSTASLTREGIVVAEETTKSAAVGVGAGVTTGIIATAAGTQAAITGPAAILRSIMELGPIAGPLVMGISLIGMIALINSLVGGFATGGLVTGPGTGTSDSIPARLSNGEFVMTAAAVDRFGPDFMASLNAGALDLGALPGRVARQSSSSAAASPGSGGGAAPAQRPNATNVFFDRHEMARYIMRHPEFEHHVMDVNQRRKVDFLNS